MTLLFIGLMFCGTFALGLSDVFRKKYLNEGLDDQVFLTITLFLTGILLLPVVIFLGIPDIKDGFWSAFVVTMLLNLISQNLFIKAFKMSEASLIAPLRLIIPLFVVITGFLFLGEKPSFMGVVGIVITMFGLWFLLSDGRNKYQNFLLIIKDRGVICGFLGSLLFAISFPFDKIVVVKSSAIFSTFLIFSVLGLATFILNIIRDREFGALVNHSFRKNLKANILVSLLNSVGVVLTNQALNYSLVAYASSIKRLQVLWTIILSGKILEEKQIRRRLLSAIIMFMGILLSIIWK